MRTILRKELADYFNSVRVPVLFIMVLLASAAGLFAAHQGIRQAISETSTVTGGGFIFLKLFTSSGDVIPSLIFFISLFVPIIGIALGFDAINNEHSGGTLSRILSQPIFRDNVINGKFLAGIITLAIMLATTLLLVSGYGLRMIGVPPTAEEIIRLFLYLLFTVIYGAFWMGLAILFSILFRRVAASLLVSIAIWLFFSFFMFMIAPAIANALVSTAAGTQAEILRNAELQQTILRFSPVALFEEATMVLLLPLIRSLGFITVEQSTYMLSNPISLGQSIVLIWPHLTGLISASAICFAISYVLFMRQEIRAT